MLADIAFDGAILPHDWARASRWGAIGGVTGLAMVLVFWTVARVRVRVAG